MNRRGKFLLKKFTRPSRFAAAASTSSLKTIFMQTPKNSAGIKQWSEDDRPREKLTAKGAAALTNAELLAILINSGTRAHSALDLARIILQQAHDNLRELGRLTITELQRTKGIGEARAITIAAALELGRRRQTADSPDRKAITSAQDAADIILPLLNDLPHEAFCVLYLNQANRLIRHEIISTGGLTGTVADIRLILKQALMLNSNQLIVAHNHPSGNSTPSAADRQLTEKLRDAARLMDIRLLDHVIVAGNQLLSMAEEGYI
jgi:DNA repair protein RadC